MFKTKSKFGFTLIELLVVIAIIGLLVNIVILALVSARIKARDAKRKADLDQMRKALEIYFNENLSFPQPGNPNDEQDIQVLATYLVPTYLPLIPNDPKNNPENYQYVWWQNGASYGILVPFGNDGGTTCAWRSFSPAQGNKNWFDKAPDCSY